MDYESQRKIRPYLDPNEKLLWSGKPKLGIVFRRSDILIIPFSLLWTGLAIFIVWHIEFAGALIFVAIGVYLIFGRYWVDSRIRSKTYYGLTDERIIIISGLVRPAVESHSLVNLPKMKVLEKSDGSGTIIIGFNRFKYTWPSGLYWPFTRNYFQPSLEFIPNVNSVYNEILSAQEKYEENRN